MKMIFYSLMILIAKTPESIKGYELENISVDIDNSVSVIKQLFGDSPTIENIVKMMKIKSCIRRLFGPSTTQAS